MQHFGQIINIFRLIIDFSPIAATIIITPEDTDYETEQHLLLLEQVSSEWLLTDLDQYKAAAIKRTSI